ncbi:unnamed protein product [Anisakis simplex]|uniref:Uncharacterized protein n=1 Tax=Anisakis simplex TaxID=6269 RepID=A0A0M3J398_ANISI|nr:unnamed protein product [Anisakis simplex]
MQKNKSCEKPCGGGNGGGASGGGSGGGGGGGGGGDKGQVKPSTMDQTKFLFFSLQKATDTQRTILPIHTPSFLSGGT